MRICVHARSVHGFPLQELGQTKISAALTLFQHICVGSLVDARLRSSIRWVMIAQIKTGSTAIRRKIKSNRTNEL